MVIFLRRKTIFVKIIITMMIILIVTVRVKSVLYEVIIITMEMSTIKIITTKSTMNLDVIIIQRKVKIIYARQILWVKTEIFFSRRSENIFAKRSKYGENGCYLKSKENNFYKTSCSSNKNEYYTRKYENCYSNNSEDCLSNSGKVMLDKLKPQNTNEMFKEMNVSENFSKTFSGAKYSPFKNSSTISEIPNRTSFENCTPQCNDFSRNAKESKEKCSSATIFDVKNKKYHRDDSGYRSSNNESNVQDNKNYINDNNYRSSNNENNVTDIKDYINDNNYRNSNNESNFTFIKDYRNSNNKNNFTDIDDYRNSNTYRSSKIKVMLLILKIANIIVILENTKTTKIITTTGMLIM
ncbi:hypothetical protein EDEG_03118 [Edhazardia aedis USNM 41457]|uniref:Uncharacterized protein n=1 Tax=Edhazardia aedis (strain USNM 41457) TaxID=1003232 RepID=J8ZRZ0_EDHAE|nr:hypothetical protein EDEG_03118 [Edhazardia aedis USNM 41457]|eukprot:EJW02468.1 hypothetical protein EDEG_03118 [Edhazardia aedis USNM 41457]